MSFVIDKLHDLHSKLQFDGPELECYLLCSLCYELQGSVQILYLVAMTSAELVPSTATSRVKPCRPDPALAVKQELS